MSEDIENDVTTGRLLTLNQICEIVGGHYQTTKKIVNKYVENGTLKKGEVLRRNRPFEAYYVTDTILAEIQIVLKEIKKTMTPAKLFELANHKSNDNVHSTSTTDEFQKLDENVPVKMLDNVKFYEVVKQNNELENKVRLLEAHLKDKELEYAHEREKINGEKVQLQADNYKLQADIKLIEDKQKTFESAWAEEKQKAEKLENTVKQRNIQLLITGALLLVVVVVISCYFVFAR